MMLIQEAVDHCASYLEGKKIESSRLSAELIVGHVTSLSRTEVLSTPNRKLTNTEETNLDVAMKERGKHKPLPYITGEVEFYSIPFSISSGIFIPRPETETLVDAALDIAKEISDAPKIYDLGTGCGNIIIALALNLDDGEFWASDISNNAVQTASLNVRRHDLQNYVEVKEGQLFSPMRKELATEFDIVVSNPPYIRSGDIPKLPPQIKDFEPHIALDGGRDGMSVIKSILDGAAPILKPGGYVLLEADPITMPSIRSEVQRRTCYEDFKVLPDASGKDRVAQFRTKAKKIGW